MAYRYLHVYVHWGYGWMLMFQSGTSEFLFDGLTLITHPPPHPQIRDHTNIFSGHQINSSIQFWIAHIIGTNVELIWSTYLHYSVIWL